LFAWFCNYVKTAKLAVTQLFKMFEVRGKIQQAIFAPFLLHIKKLFVLLLRRK